MLGYPKTKSSPRYSKRKPDKPDSDAIDSGSKVDGLLVKMFVHPFAMPIIMQIFQEMIARLNSRCWWVSLRKAAVWCSGYI
jgi:hypothetical protein